MNYEDKIAIIAIVAMLLVGALAMGLDILDAIMLGL